MTTTEQSEALYEALGLRDNGGNSCPKIDEDFLRAAIKKLLKTPQQKEIYYDKLACKYVSHRTDENGFTKNIVMEPVWSTSLPALVKAIGLWKETQ
jgi:hypothetical protein